MPQATIELEIDDVAAAIREPKEEPWSDPTARFLSPEGLLIGITYTPMLRENAAE